jgi:shikimate dehydrogenase
MEINGKTKVLGVMGCPIEHSISPVIHNNLAAELKDNLVYAPFKVDEGKVQDAVKGAFALGIQGLNVTVPHKSAVIPFLCDIDPLAKRIGAVNTLVYTNEGYKGYNTDMPGLLRAMKHDGAEVAGKDVIILGAGGVARAVAFLLADSKVNHIYVLNRTIEKAKAIEEEIKAYAGDIISAHELSEYSSLYGDGYVVIQATNVGMHPDVDRAVLEDEEFYKKVSFGYDLVYNPAETKFMKLCKASGAEAYNGLRMLLYQGVIAYELYTGKSVDDELSEKIYHKMAEAMGIK